MMNMLKHQSRKLRSPITTPNTPNKLLPKSLPKSLNRALAIIGILLVSCSPNAPQSGGGERAASVPIASVESGIVTDSSDYVANLQSRQSVTLQPRVDGYVQEIYVKAGDRVEAGAPILRIDFARPYIQQVI
jgi:multidrug efflux pump subunit AcrA (membrane-fusion protein)